MSDFPASAVAPRGMISTAGPHSNYYGYSIGLARTVPASAIWPTANLAIFCPVRVEQHVTAYQMALQVGTQSGNLDVGIYDEAGNRLVSAGSTAVAAAGVQVVNIADTLLVPGIYYLTMACDNITAAFLRMSSGGTQAMRVLGVRSQALASVVLPATATFATIAQSYVPVLGASVISTT